MYIQMLSIFLEDNGSFIRKKSFELGSLLTFIMKFSIAVHLNISRPFPHNTCPYVCAQFVPMERGNMIVPRLVRIRGHARDICPSSLFQESKLTRTRPRISRHSSRPRTSLRRRKFIVTKHVPLILTISNLCSTPSLMWSLPITSAVAGCIKTASGVSSGTGSTPGIPFTLQFKAAVRAALSPPCQHHHHSQPAPYRRGASISTRVRVCVCARVRIT